MVSSTAIRWSLAAGDVVAAGRYLGRPFAVRGEVVPGERRGRRLGFPTANLRLDPGALWPRYGVYLVEIAVDASRHHHGVANVGVRPTFGGRDPGIEVFLLDYEADLYRATIEVSFLRFLRPERRFATPDELRAQIELDVARARGLLAEGRFAQS
ncbi:MAG: riboflavin biosynthesis protein RibF, partial [Firmicutes bacterium]|nr:riboflavin biosynthesis protein RibF [Bacillota bacterium]